MEKKFIVYLTERYEGDYYEDIVDSFETREEAVDCLKKIYEDSIISQLKGLINEDNENEEWIDSTAKGIMSGSINSEERFGFFSELTDSHSMVVNQSNDELVNAQIEEI